MLVARWVFFLGAILNVIAAVFCDGGDSPRHRKQRPIPPRRLAKNTIAITLSGAAVFLPAFFVFCGGDGSIAGYDTCEEPISSNPFGFVKIYNTYWMRFGVYIYSTFSVLFFYHVVDFQNDFQNAPLSGLTYVGRCIHIFSLVDTRLMKVPINPYNWSKLLWSGFLFFAMANAIGYYRASPLSTIVPATPSVYFQGFLAAWLVYFAIELAYIGWDLVLRLTIHVAMPPLHNDPVLSASVTEFWGGRWNRAVGDELSSHFFNPIVGRDTSPKSPPSLRRNAPDASSPATPPKPAPKRPHSIVKTLFAMFVTFFCSGLFHSWPYLMCKRNVKLALMFETYFIVEGVLCLVEKTVLKYSPKWVPRLWLFAAILAPFPLFSIPFLDLFEGFCLFEGGITTCLF